VEILVIQTAFPGDLFLSLPLLKNLRVHFPNSKVHLMCRKGIGQTFLEHHLVDEIHEVEKGKASSYLKILEKLGSNKIDLVLSPHRSLRTALFIRRLKPKQSIGYRLWWNGLFFSMRIPYHLDLPDALRQLELLVEASDSFKELWESKASMGKYLGDKSLSVVKYDQWDFPSWMSGQLTPWRPEGNRICLAPGSVWATKKWPAESFSKLAKSLLDKGFNVSLVGAAADQEDCNKVATADSRIENLCGKTSLSELLSLFQKSRALVSNDSGAMHVAAATGLPTVCIYGPTVPEFGYRPWQKSVRLIQTPLSCRPCSPHGTKQCPIGTHECMKSLDPKFVNEELSKFLSETDPENRKT